ncbi:hypothetical protein [Pimelobacter simplex]|uniref:hypothetical protein n=1 Tax=Nocardioides simplex TaxID=2045 RepID=UPI003AB0B5AB
MRRAWRTTAVAVPLLALLALAGCSVVSQPDPAGWDQSAQQALDDASGEVGTARLALRAAADDRTWSSYTTVLVSEAEEAAGTAEEDLSRLQVPPERTDAAATALDLLGQAAEATRQVRALAVAGRYDDAELADELARLGTALDQEALRAAARAEQS